jgi:hypothetical protein
MTIPKPPTPGERGKASKVRNKARPTPDERAFLRQYDARVAARDAAKRPVRARARALEELAPEPSAPSSSSTSSSSEPAPYQAPAPPSVPDEAKLGDFRALDPLPPDPSPPSPSELAPSHGAELVPESSSSSSHGCGLCSDCRSGEHAPRCAVSGSVIPRPLAADEAASLAEAMLAGIALTITAWHKHRPSPATEAQTRKLGRGLESLSTRHDLQALADLSPYLMIAGALVSYGSAANAEAGAKAAEEQRSRSAAA